MGIISHLRPESTTSLRQTLGLGQLTKKHGDILVPGGEALGVAFRSAFMDEPQKGDSGHDLEDLAEQTCGKLHSRDSFEVFEGWLCFHHTTSGSLSATA